MKGRFLIHWIELILYVSVSFAATMPEEDPKTFEELIVAIDEHYPISIKAIKKYFQLDESFFKGKPKFSGIYATTLSDGLYVIILTYSSGNNYSKHIVITLTKKYKQISYKSFANRCLNCKSTDLFADVYIQEEERNIEIQYYEPIFKTEMYLDSERKIRKTEHWLITTKGYTVPNTKKK